LVENSLSDWLIPIQLFRRIRIESNLAEMIIATRLSVARHTCSSRRSTVIRQLQFSWSCCTVHMPRRPKPT